MRPVLFAGNRFSDNVLGITVLGDVTQAAIRENVFERHAIFGPVVEGGTPRCPLAGGGSVPIELTPPEEVTIEDNLGVDSPIGTAATINTQIRANALEGGVFGILVAEDTGMRISRNRITGAGGGILVFGGVRVTVIENSVADSFSGAELYDSGDGVVVASNEFSADIGVWVFLGASGYRIVENSFPASGFVDVWLLSGSTGNTVINGGDPITVLDQGTDNRLVGNITPF
jgi:nitrous oxidase accessory protein NosD